MRRILFFENKSLPADKMLSGLAKVANAAWGVGFEQLDELEASILMDILAIAVTVEKLKEHFPDFEPALLEARLEAIRTSRISRHRNGGVGE